MSEPLAEALMAHLLRVGLLDGDDIHDIATTLERMQQPEAAHIARCSLIRAIEPDAIEESAQEARSRFRVIEPDGGKETV